MNHKISILFFGTPGFALPALEALIAEKYNLIGVVTNSDEPVGRKKILTPPPVKVLAEKYNIPVFQPERLEIQNFKFKISQVDLAVVAAYGKIIPKSILEIPKFGTLNIHPSLLPRWRGASPIQSAILAGDVDTGVTIMQLDEKMDHGPVVAQQTTPIGDRKAVYPQLHDELAAIGAKLLIETIPDYLSGAIMPIPQDESKATYCNPLKKDDGRIDWKKPAEEIERMVRAYNPWPSTWTTWSDNGSTLRIRIEQADLTLDEPLAGSPGLVWKKEEALLVQTGKGSIEIKRLTLEGKKTISGAELLHGYPQLIGATLL
ncbi:MAG: methionyl-tRNA formyltransferase [Candidatus Sungbacteria bacterium]|nr:methionyl-tRNA formyltransferase [Candidatus Sungbacteria bacterium]